MKIAFIGDRTASAGFKAIGVEVFDVPRPSDARTVWKSIEFERYAIILITEPEYEVLADELEQIKRQTMPVVTVVPPVAGSAGAAGDEIRALVERAVGTDVMFRQ